jgi:hypothetical protein
LELKGLAIDAFGPVGKWPHAQQYIGRIKDFTSARSKWHQTGFRTSANAIIICHVVATLLAILGGKLSVSTLPGEMGYEVLKFISVLIPVLISIEVVLLLVGFRFHIALYRMGHVRALTDNRLVAEIMRSLTRIEMARADFRYLLSLPVPREFGPVLRTCTLLLLSVPPRADSETWAVRRDEYVRARLTDPTSGQMDYYKSRARNAKDHLRVANWLFRFFTLLAVLMASAELLERFRHISPRACRCNAILGRRR